MASNLSSSSRISVVIPLYNHASYIDEAVQSALGQTVAPAEIIVVDDGSTDASAARMRVLCEKHRQIIFWSQPNQGAHYALNAGIYRATSEFVSILNSDDAYTPTRLEECLAALQKGADEAAVATGISFFDAAGSEATSEWYQNARSFYDQVKDLSLALIKGNFFVTTSNLFVRKSIFEEIGHFSPLRYTHDLDFCLRLLACGKPIRFLDRPLLKYRIHGGNTIRENRAAVQVERAAVVAFYLHTAWSCRRKRDTDWTEYVRKVSEILDRESLGALQSHFFERLENLASLDLGFGSWTRDLQFRAYLRESVGSETAFVEESARTRTAMSDLRGLADTTSLEHDLVLCYAALADHRAWIEKLEEGKQWLTGQNENLQQALASRDSEIADLKAWLAKLEEGKQWLAGQNENLQQAVASRDAETATLKAWTAKLDEGKQWLSEQADRLKQELDRRETVIREQQAWIGTLDAGNKRLMAQNEQLRNEIGEIRGSRAWRFLEAIGRAPGRRKQSP